MENNLILVNTENEIIGFCEKLEAHRLGLLHRAFSIFLVDIRTGDILLQKRAAGKYHSAGLWTNACCSHPRKDEEIWVALSGRLKEELGLENLWEQGIFTLTAEEPPVCNRFYECGSFRYFADFGELKEHEIDRVFLLPVDASKISLALNPEEAERVRWVSREQLRAWYASAPQEFTQWFDPAYQLLNKAFSGEGSPIPATDR